MANFAIRVENLSKRFHIGVLRGRHDTLRDHVVHRVKTILSRDRREPEPERADLIWALKDVSFEIKAGEVVAFVGKNGAGKSTLLKVLSKITEPTEGRVMIAGRVGSLLEVGTGFHPELTGRENVYLSGAILGMSKDEIDRKFDEIVCFSEIEKFIDTPVKRYSSGMYVRLAFSVAAHLEPQILLTDEVLSVGDFAFQQKCLDKIKALTANGMTVLLVSHHMATIQNACTYAFYLKAGRIIAQGAPVDVIEDFRRDLNATAERHVDTTSDHKVQILGLEVFGADGRPTRDIQFGSSVKIKISLRCFERIDNPMISLSIKRTDGIIACSFSNWYDNFALGYIDGDCTLEGWLPPLRLIPDYYEAHVYVLPWAGGHLVGDVSRMVPYAQKKIGDFRVIGSGLNVHDGVFQAPALKWCLNRGNEKEDFGKITPESVQDALLLRDP